MISEDVAADPGILEMLYADLDRDSPHFISKMEQRGISAEVCARCGRPAHWDGDLVHCRCNGSVCRCGGGSNHPVTAHFVRDVLQKHPQLTAWGYGPPSRAKKEREEWERNREGARAELLVSLTAVRHAYDYLAKLPRTQRATVNSPSSYNLKHRAEEMEPRTYVSNGALIAAALILEIPMWQEQGGSYNPGIGVKTPR